MTPRDAARPVVLMLYRAASDAFGKSVFFIVTLVAARRLSQDGFGVFSLGTTVGWIAAVATDFGIQLHTARAIAQQPERAGRLLRAWGRLRLATAAIAIAAIAAGLLITRTPRAVAAAIFLLALVYITAALLEFVYYIFRGLSRSDLESTLTIAQRLGTLVLALLALWWRPEVTVLAGAMLVPTALTLWWAARWARTLVHNPAAARPARPAIDDARSVLAIGAGIVLSALYFRFDIFLVNGWAGPSAVALYNAAFRLVDALRLLPAAVVAVMLPALFRGRDWRLVVRLTLALGLGATLVTVALGSAAPWLMPALYGAPYAGAVHAFRILLMAFPLMAANLVLTHQLLGCQGHRTYALLCGVALLWNLALNSRLIPALGIAGAAWATLWTEGLITVGCVAALFAIHARPVPLAEQRAC